MREPNIARVQLIHRFCGTLTISMRSLFPLFLKLEGRRCLVVGAAEIGEPKIAGLLGTAGIVDVVAPHATEKVEEWAQERKVHWFKRKFQDSDLDGCS